MEPTRPEPPPPDPATSMPLEEDVPISSEKDPIQPTKPPPTK